MQVNSLVVGMDLSDAAIAGALWASECFAPARLTLVHVIDPPDRPHFALHLLPEAETVLPVAREYAQRQLDDITRRLKGGKSQSDIRIGKAHEQVVAVARETAADLVVIGPHDNRPRTSGFLGTTAERIVRTSPVTVLVATAPVGGTRAISWCLSTTPRSRRQFSPGRACSPKSSMPTYAAARLEQCRIQPRCIDGVCNHAQ